MADDAASGAGAAGRLREAPLPSKGHGRNRGFWQGRHDPVVIAGRVAAHAVASGGGHAGAERLVEPSVSVREIRRAGE